jgi:hypothetical protein
VTSGTSFDKELEEIERRRPAPPPFLFKYVCPDRIDVLENASIRFTPPLNTNDIFEVRQTFDLVIGPKMLAAFKVASTEVDFDESLRGALDDSPLAFLSNEEAKALVSKFVGGDLESLTKGLLSQVIDQMPAHLNAPEKIDELLVRVTSKQLLLSLSERADSSPMWAHYAANSTGFVIAFDTASAFFRRGNQGELQGLHRVEYFDGRVPEIMDNPYAALISKQADWSYEREWRLYAQADDISEVLSDGEEEIHLVGFPREAIQRVILGIRASTKLEEGLRSALEADYGGIPLMRLSADRATAKLTEIPT